MGLPWYCVREDVKLAMDMVDSARSNADIDRQIDASARMIDGAMHRTFWPQTDTRSWDWPDIQVAHPWRLWFDQNEMASVSQLSSSGVVIPPSTYKLYPNWAPGFGKSYQWLELDVSQMSTFNATATWQNSISASGVFMGCALNEFSAGTLASGINSSVTSFSPGIPGYRGVGSILRIDNERMIVTGRTMVSTGIALVGNLLAQMAGNLVGVADSTQVALGEVIMIDGEKMYVTDTSGPTNLVVKRAWDGTPLAAHTGGATIYAARQLTVQRGAVGTTAASHSTSAPILEYDPPALIRQLNVAQAVVNLTMTRAGYPSPTGRRSQAMGVAGERSATAPSDLSELWERAETAHRRKGRLRTI